MTEKYNEIQNEIVEARAMIALIRDGSDDGVFTHRDIKRLDRLRKTVERLEQAQINERNKTRRKRHSHVHRQ